MRAPLITLGPGSVLNTPLMPRLVKRSARFSRCKRYRYALSRTWDARLPTVLFICFNPSKADAIEDDPTIRRCIGLARKLECGRLVVANLFAYRTTKPADLRRTERPVG